ncbi:MULTISPECIES: hypothetical protein [unclassified Streptomyces]|uniref:hypothetical protein n=1 Tax=unclassified Streptomyces TaxID=2593676 RepID=UPI001D04C9F3|nr:MULTISPECIES: hypothetical protein [unclassified Streptomyces]
MLLAFLLSAYPVGDVVLGDVADGGRHLDAVRPGVHQVGEVQADLAVVVFAGPYVDACESAHVALRRSHEGHVIGVLVRLYEASALHPAVRPPIAVGLHQLLELDGAVLVFELLVFPRPASPAFDPADLVGGGAVLLLALPDARHAGTVRAGGGRRLATVWPKLRKDQPVTCFRRSPADHLG